MVRDESINGDTTPKEVFRETLCKPYGELDATNLSPHEKNPSHYFHYEDTPRKREIEMYPRYLTCS